MNTRIFSFTVLALAAAIAFAAGKSDPTRSSATKGVEPAKLIESVKSGTPQEKAAACKQLAIVGGDEAVAAVAPLLTDKDLSSWARITLEAIPGQAADAALREAMDKLQGRLLIGVMNSLAVRRDAQAVDRLYERLKDKDAEVASAAAVALGRIGGEKATDMLVQALNTVPAAVRSAVAEGCILAAEQLVAAGQKDKALTVFDAVRKADLPAQRVLEATRGAILAQGNAGLPLWREQLQSKDKGRFALGLRMAREIAGPEATKILLAELDQAAPERHDLFVVALAERGDASVLPAIMKVAKNGSPLGRRAAFASLGKLGDANCVPMLLEAAAGADAELAQAALKVLANLPGAEIDRQLVERLQKAEGALRVALIDLAGQRPIPGATSALRKALDDADASIRTAALTAMGATVTPTELPILIERMTKARHEGEADTAEKALETACRRMPDREAAAAQLVAAMSDASTATKSKLLSILSSLGGPTALKAVATAAKEGDVELKDAASRSLGAWMDLEAGPVLLDLAKNGDEKYRVRAVRGYIRLARQFDMPDAERVKMCRAAMEISQRPAEKRLVIELLGRHPGPETLALALEAAKSPDLKDEAAAVAMLIGSKSGVQSDALKKLLGELGQGEVKIEIVKAEYGAGANVKDVTTILRKHVYDFPVILLPSPKYNSVFGGDPAQGQVKQLKVQYRMNDKAGEAVFTEDSPIRLPEPK